MHANEYEEALRYITRSGYGSADDFRGGTHVNDWSRVREGMRRMVEQLQMDVTATPELADSRTQDNIHGFGLNRALTALTSTTEDPPPSETERAYRVACGLAYALKAVLNRLGEHETGVGNG